MPAAGHIDIHIHGTPLNDKKTKVECNHCGKQVTGFYRLKCHLANIGKDVKHCPNVPEDVKEILRNKLLENKKDYLGKLHFPDFPWKKKISRQLRCENGQSSSSANGNYANMALTTSTGANEQGSSSLANFFNGNEFDFNAANPPTFQEMMATTLNLGPSSHIISRSQELNGWIPQDQAKEIQEYVQNIRLSWESTGCTILLDEWIDNNGRNLVSFFVDCPQGPIYLKSLDVSDIVQDIGAVMFLIDGVIKEIGVDNVVQIISSNTKGPIGIIGKKFIEKSGTIFWTVSASYCIELILQKIGIMGSVQDILDKAKKITKFIYARPGMLQLFKDHSRGNDLFMPCKISSATPYTTLENIVSEKLNLLKMFTSYEWNNSMWASSEDGAMIFNLVADSTFWSEAAMIVNATIPLLRLLCLIVGDAKPRVGYIYELMDQMKETIKYKLKNKATVYMPFWGVIDEVWDTNLHSPLHAAGIYFNPAYVYSSDYQKDSEVACGLLDCLVHMVKEHDDQDMISDQLNMYKRAEGPFEEGRVDIQTKEFPADKWWTTYATHCPDLQRFAFRIVSQTCDGSSRYGLQRGIVEKMLGNGRNSVEQQLASHMVYMQYNSLLKNFTSVLDYDISADEIDPMDDWIVDESLLDMNAAAVGGGEGIYLLNDNQTQLM